MHAISWAVYVEVADDLQLPDEGKGYFSMDSCDHGRRQCAVTASQVLLWLTKRIMYCVQYDSLILA